MVKERVWGLAGLGAGVWRLRLGVGFRVLGVGFAGRVHGVWHRVEMSGGAVEMMAPL